jgi:peptidoglycan-associated lipoprotein
MTPSLHRFGIPLLTLALLAACSTQPASEPSGGAGAQPATAAPQPQASRQASQSSAASAQVNVKSIPAKRSIYYAYDQSDIKPESRALIEAHAQYLREHPSTKVRVEGNADERGSAEYNVALGQRRAEGVTKLMTLLGIAEDRIEAVSFGKEKPKVPGHNEDSWSENRRSDIVYR